MEGCTGCRLLAALTHPRRTHMGSQKPMGNITVTIRVTNECTGDRTRSQHCSSILETSPTKTDVQALIAVPKCSPVVSFETSDPPAGISGGSSDQPEQCLPAIDSSAIDSSAIDFSAIDSSAIDFSAIDFSAIDSLAIDSLTPEKQHSPKGQKEGLKLCDPVKGSGNDKSAADCLGAQKSADVNQDGKLCQSHSTRGEKKKQLLARDIAFCFTPNFPASPEESRCPELKKQRQTRTSVTSESVGARTPLTHISHFNIQRQITDNIVSKTKNTKMVQKHRSQKLPKWLSTSTKENALCLANLKQKTKERETLLTTKSSDKGKQDCESLPSSLGSPPPSKSSSRKKPNQVPLMSRDLWSSTTCNSLQRPNTDSEQALDDLASNVHTNRCHSMQVRDVEQDSLLSAGTKDVTQSAHPNNISDKDMQAAENHCDNGQHVDQNLRTDCFSSSELSLPSVTPPKQSSLRDKSARSPVLGSKISFQDSQRPEKRSGSVPAKSGLQHEKLPVQKENFWSQPRAVSCQASQVHNKEVQKESTVSLNAATSRRKSHSSGQGACGKEMKASRTSPSKAGSFAMKGEAHVRRETEGTAPCSNHLSSGTEPHVSKALLAADGSAGAVRSWKNFWHSSRNVVKTATGQLPVVSAAKERLSDKAPEENYSKSQKKEGGRQCFPLGEKQDVPKASSIADCFREPVMPRKPFWHCLAGFSASTQHRKSEVKGMRAVEDKQLPAVCEARGKFSDKRPNGGSSKAELYHEKKKQCTSHTAKCSEVKACPGRTVSKQIELQDGLQHEVKDASVQTSFVCMIGSRAKMDREARHRLVSSLYVGEDKVKFLDPNLRPAGESAPFSFGYYAATDSVIMGIMKLRPDCEKPLAVDYVHDMCFYVLDDGLMVSTVGDAWTLLEKGSVFRLLSGMPYSFKNVGTATSKLFYVLMKPRT
ncbi:uncharacterized protein LOC144115628 isoform X2 [Amblyomma americanum]